MMDSFNVAVMNDSTDNTMALMSSMPTTRLSPEEATRMLVEALATFHRDPTAEMDCHLFSVSSETFQCIRQTLEAIFNEDSDGERFFRQYIQCLQEAIKEQQEIFSKAQQFTSDYMDCLNRNAELKKLNPPTVATRSDWNNWEWLSSEEKLEKTSMSSPAPLPVDVVDVMSKRRRSSLPKYAVAILKEWLFNHLEHPYPNEEEKQELCQRTGLTTVQVSNWFINARRRTIPKIQKKRHAECLWPPQTEESVEPNPKRSKLPPSSTPQS